jgi:hypothetical protein
MGNPVTRSEAEKCLKLDESILYIKWASDSSKCKKYVQMAPYVSMSVFVSYDSDCLVHLRYVTFNSFFLIYFNIFFWQLYFTKALGKTWR